MDDNNVKKPAPVDLVLVGVLSSSPCPGCEEARASEGGPSKVVSDGYRSGWDRIFGQKQEATLPN